MVVVVDYTASLSPVGVALDPNTLRRRLRLLVPSMRATKHLLKDCTTMKGYIRNTLDQQGKALKPTPKVHDHADNAQEEDIEFPEAERCLMIFKGSQAYKSKWLC
jgi:hypothetical protein